MRTAVCYLIKSSACAGSWLNASPQAATAVVRGTASLFCKNLMYSPGSAPAFSRTSLSLKQTGQAETAYKGQVENVLLTRMKLARPSGRRCRTWRVCVSLWIAVRASTR